MTQTTATPEVKPQLKTFGRTRLLPGKYTLDLSAVSDTPLTMNGNPSTFVDVYCSLRDSKIEPPTTQFRRDRYVTDKGEIQLAGDWPLLRTLSKLVDLLLKGIDPHHVMWFYYDHDWSRDADEIYTLFVVYDGKVVMEACHFGSDEPLILKREIDTDPIWHSHPYFDEALDRYWYRRFYGETMTGQLMLLRPDEPILYYYERPQARDSFRHIEFVTLLKMYRLLWVAIPLLIGIAFPSVKQYMAVVAVVLGVDVLWRAWATRKVGHD